MSNSWSLISDCTADFNSNGPYGLVQVTYEEDANPGTIYQSYLVYEFIHYVPMYMVGWQIADSAGSGTVIDKEELIVDNESSPGYNAVEAFACQDYMAAAIQVSSLPCDMVFP